MSKKEFIIPKSYIKEIIYDFNLSKEFSDASNEKEDIIIFLSELNCFDKINDVYRLLHSECYNIIKYGLYIFMKNKDIDKLNLFIEYFIFQDFIFNGVFFDTLITYKTEIDTNYIIKKIKYFYEDSQDFLISLTSCIGSKENIIFNQIIVHNSKYLKEYCAVLMHSAISYGNKIAIKCLFKNFKFSSRDKKYFCKLINTTYEEIIK